MIQWIIDFFTSLIDMLKGVLNLLVTAFNGLISIVKMLPSLITDMSTAVGLLPTVLATFFSISLTVTIIFLILGRGKGGVSNVIKCYSIRFKLASGLVFDWSDFFLC